MASTAAIAFSSAFMAVALLLLRSTFSCIALCSPSFTLPWDEAPHYLIRDRPTAARSPWQNGHAERLIGSIRRECLDDLVVFGEAHLRRVLKNYGSYYNQVRTHLALDKDAPEFRHVERVGNIQELPLLGGLHHHYVRV
jgi:hypothetical protein